MKEKFILGIDLGGTKISSAILTRSGKIVATDTIPTFASKGVKIVVNRIYQCVQNVCKKAEISLSEISCIGVGAPGPVNSKKGVILNPPNLKGWKKVYLKRILEKKFNTKVVLENDANCAALAELYFGNGKKFYNFIYITISTGIGGGIIIDKKIYSGSSGSAGEIGHIVIDLNSKIKCSCGKFGHLEGLASGKAIEKIYKISPIALAEKLKNNDKSALKIIDEIGYIIGIGLTNLVNILNPQAIIIGGGVSNIGNPLLKKINKTIKQNALAKVKILPAKLKNNVGTIGAAALCLLQS